MANQERMSTETPLERSTLQVLLSGRIIITGILNEILLRLPEETEQSEFLIESECSLMMDSEARQAAREYIRGVNLLTLLASSATSLEEACKQTQDNQTEPSLYSLYKESQGTDEYNSCANGQNSYQERNQSKKVGDSRPSKAKHDKQDKYSLFHPKSVDFSRYASSTWKGLMRPDSSKSSKSVTFTSQENANNVNPMGMLIEPRTDNEQEKVRNIRSISTRLPWPTRGMSRFGSGGTLDDLDLWLAFLTETGLMQASDSAYQSCTTENHIPVHPDMKIDDQDSMIRQMDFYHKIPCETFTTSIRDDYESIHQKCPGLFWDTVTMDDPQEAYQKVKRIIRNIVESQHNIKPMFDIDFANLQHYPNVEKRLIDIRNEIAPQRLFY